MCMESVFRAGGGDSACDLELRQWKRGALRLFDRRGNVLRYTVRLWSDATLCY